jgi:hypothetical protein
LYSSILKKQNNIMEQSIKHSSKKSSVNRKENKYGAHNYHPLPVVLEKEVFCMDVW